MKTTLWILLATLLMGAAQSPPAPPSPAPPKPPAPPAAPATQPAPVPPSAPPRAGQMTTYIIGFLKKGPAWTAAESPELKSLQEAHLANIRRLVGTGELVLAGPFTDDGELRGLFLFQVDSLAKAKALCDTDPMVKSGRLVVELHPWMGPTGIRYERSDGAGH